MNIHNRIEPSRRDDLESVGYIMNYLLNDFTNKKVIDYLNYCKQLSFEQTPDYNYLYSILGDGPGTDQGPGPKS